MRRSDREWVHKMSEAENYEGITDEELIAMIRSGDNGPVDFVMNKYKNMVKCKAKALFLVGGDTEDLIQEGMIGLFRAICDYDKSGGSSFATFASMCTERQMYKLIQSHNRQKNSPLNNYVSLYQSAGEDESATLNLESMISTDNESNPEVCVIARESASKMEELLKSALSSFEREVFDLFVQGYNYRDIAEELDKTPKSVDNALRRIRRKLTDIIENRIEAI